jgi:predicted secreted hydrolase
VNDSGTTRSLTGPDFQVEVIDHWTSPHSGATYPSGWRVRIPEAKVSLEIVPSMHDQELNQSFAYWECSVTVEGEFDGSCVTGSGFVELTRYAESMAGRF